MADDGFHWYGDDVRANLAQASQIGLQAGAYFLRDALWTAFSAFDNQGPSLPGEFPHKQSIQAAQRGYLPLADTIIIYQGDESDIQELDEIASVAVGTPSPYALDLELGTSKMLPRPAWLPISVDSIGHLEDIIGSATRDVVPGGDE